MSNLENFSNIYANLAESAYSSRPVNFPFKQLTPDKQKRLKSGKSIRVDFSKNAVDQDGDVIVRGGTNLPNDGIVYLQPDPTVKTYKEIGSYRTPNVNGGYTDHTYLINTHRKGLLTDDVAGFNAYFVTDTPTLNKKTKETYLAIRGSDAMGIGTLNDWWDNDAQFALKNAHIPQAKLATEAIHKKIKEMKQTAPNAKISITGHSLGTMVSAQAVAKRRPSIYEK